MLLWGLAVALRVHARVSPAMRALMAEKDFVAQVMVKDGSRGRWYRFAAGRLVSRAGVLANPDVTLRFKSAELGLRLLLHLGSGMFHWAYPLLRPFLEPMGVVNAAKNFAFEVLGPDEFSLRFTTILNTLLTSRWRQGTPVAGGEPATPTTPTAARCSST